jgi:hypothetical protein
VEDIPEAATGLRAVTAVIEAAIDAEAAVVVVVAQTEGGKSRV